MTESQAWRIVAEEYDAGRTLIRFLCVNLIQTDHTPYRNAAIVAIPWALREKMVNRIEAALPEGAGAAYSDCEGDKQDARILACLLFSEIARDGR